MRRVKEYGMKIGKNRREGWDNNGWKRRREWDEKERKESRGWDERTKRGRDQQGWTWSVGWDEKESKERHEGTKMCWQMMEEEPRDWGKWKRKTRKERNREENWDEQRKRVRTHFNRSAQKQIGMRRGLVKLNFKVNTIKTWSTCWGWLVMSEDRRRSPSCPSFSTDASSFRLKHFLDVMSGRRAPISSLIDDSPRVHWVHLCLPSLIIFTYWSVSSAANSHFFKPSFPRFICGFADKP